MFFKNRKKIIMDRGPSWPDYEKAEPFMIRYYLLFRKRPKWFPFNIFVHKILKNDLGDLHDHYWSYITIILKGGYLETTKDGTFSRKPGYIGFRKSDDRHSLKLFNNIPAWTLMLVGPNKGAKSHAKYKNIGKKTFNINDSSQ
tara:strand:+ start:245 stop:673 length:429 start_codon:yes stop_codon:yes gene_type:complete